MSSSRTFFIAGAARMVVPISDNSIISTRLTRPGSRRNSDATHSMTVATAQSGTPASRSIRRMVSTFIDSLMVALPAHPALFDDIWIV